MMYAMNVKKYLFSSLYVVFPVLLALFMLSATRGVASAAYTSCGMWSAVSSPNAKTTTNVFSSVSALSPQNIWAVGNSGNYVLIEHWNGKSWKMSVGPNTKTAIVGTLKGVSSLTAKDVWAVDNDTDSTSPHASYATLIEHWNGTAWNTVASPNPNPNDDILTAVTSVPNSTSAWAVGYVTDTSTYQTLTETYC